MVMNTDLLVLGGGPGGYVAAIQAAKLGMDVVLVEKEKVGGTCLHRGCIPTKALLRSGEVLRLAQRSEDFGVMEDTPASLDFKKVQQRKQHIVNQLYKGTQGLLKKNKVKVIQGTGSVMGPSIFSPVSGTVVVSYPDGREPEMISPKKVIIATGSRPKSLPNLPIDEEFILSSNGMLELEALPEKIAIIGGGVIGVEWATLLNSFGVDVTVVEFLEQLVINESASVARELKKDFERQGIHVMLGAKVLDAALKSGQVEVAIEGQKEPLIVDKVMVAIGRQPNVDNIGLENTSIKYSPKGIEVNEYCQTAEEHIYAIGDVIDTIQLAHVASAEGKLAVNHMNSKQVEPLNYINMPRCTYTYPEIASVGYTASNYPPEKKIKVGKFNFTGNGKALIVGEPDGFVEVLRDEATDDLLGVSIIGVHATDLISEISDALYLNASATEIAQAVHPHPTLSEVLQEASLDTLNMAIHK